MVEVLSCGVPPSGIGDVGFDSSPNLATEHILYEQCLPSVRLLLLEHVNMFLLGEVVQDCFDKMCAVFQLSRRV